MTDLTTFGEILKQGYPSREQLGQFPLGDKLQELDMLAWASTARVIKLQENEPDLDKAELEPRLLKTSRILPGERIGEVFRKHIRGVIKGINLLVANDIGLIIQNLPRGDLRLPPIHDYMTGFLGENHNNEDLMHFLRFSALYHDIGKVIHRDRHPILGRHLLESLSDSDTRDFKRILDSGSERWFYLMVQLIGYHDLFGVMCTGEASRPVLIDAVRQREARLAIGCLVTLNLADIYGTLPAVSPERAKIVLDDWKYMHDMLPREGAQQGILYGSKLEEKVLAEAQEQENVIERIRRLLVTPIYLITQVDIQGSHCQISEDGRDILAEKVTSDLVLDALKNRLGPELPVFCHDFALVCKFDYTLRFILALTSQWLANEFQVLAKEQQLNFAAEGPIELDRQLLQVVDIKGLAAVVVDILVRLVSNYSDLTRSKMGLRQRIGIELLGLTRSKDISDRVISLLLSDRRTEGVNWIADEATAWYFI